MNGAIHGVYAIVDPQHCGGRTPVSLARDYLAGGCRLIQLRVKDAAARLPLAREIAQLKRTYEFCFILNDDPVLAHELWADGVHLGADDLSVAEARAIVGPHALIGYSAHSLPEALAAQQAGANYVAFGTIFRTATKGPDHPVQGIARLTEVVRAVHIPVVAIGGITHETVAATWDTGIAAAAMLTALSLAPDPLTETQWFVQKLRTR